MPAGDDIRVQGWDGKVSFTGVSPFVPTGASVWEMGVSSDPERKADLDYAKRKLEHPHVDPSVTTFVFVTPHVWTGQSSWVAKRKAEWFWADVRVIDGPVITSWLERAPMVAVWLADALARPIRSLQSLDRFWEIEVTNRYSSNVSPDVVVGGRLHAVKQLTEWLQSSGESLSIVGETTDEAKYFVAAVCSKVLVGERSSRVLFVSDTSATEHLATLSQDQVIVLTDPSIYSGVHSAALAHLRIIVPEKRESRLNPGLRAIQLGDLIRSETTDALSAAGLSKPEANRVVLESKGSLQALLWMIAKPERGAFEWAKGEAARQLAPLVLAGQWTIEDHPDHEVIEQLTRRTYPEIEQVLAEWSGPGNPLEKRGQYWDWKAWDFTWARLVPALDVNEIDRYLRITGEVLSLMDPALELPLEDRWLANIRDKVHRYSPALREGLAQSLALLAINGDKAPRLGAQGRVSAFIRSLLQTENQGSRWISIAYWLPDLAEAAPDVFLDSLERFVADMEAVKAVFAEGGMFGSNPHTYLLWALERLAWSSDHVSRVVLLLGRLAAVDPGGKLSNRPAATLRSIFLPWHPATGASVDDRLALLELLFKNDEVAAWNCACSILPQPHDIGSPFVHPKWRGWDKGAEEGVSIADYWRFEQGLVGLLLEHAGLLGARWKSLLEAAPHLMTQDAKLATRITDALLVLDPKQLLRDDLRILGDAARALVMHHENMRQTDWALKGDSLETIKAIRNRFTSELRRDRYRWLFTSWPEVLREHDLTLEEKYVKLNHLRQQAVSAVIEAEGFDAILTWADEVDAPDTIGNTLAESALSLATEKVLLQRAFADIGTRTKRPNLARLGYGYVVRKALNEDSKWRDSTMAFVRETCGLNAAAFFALALPLSQDSWSFIDALDGAIQATYWKEIGINVLSIDDCEVAVPHLLKANRPYQIIDLVAMLCLDLKMASESASIERVAQLALTALSSPIDHTPADEYCSGQSVGYEIDQLLSLLERSNTPRDRLAQLEWNWLPFIHRGERGLPTLLAELSESPELFVDLLKCVYRASDESKEDRSHLDEQAQLRAHLANELLDAWDRIPGVAEDAQRVDKRTREGGLGPINPAWTGRVDYEKLTAWIEYARKLATDAKRIGVCDQTIGRQFAFAPPREDGVWPCREVCRAIESMRNDRLERGMIRGVMNRRGVFSAAAGVQEAQMANQFRRWSEAVRLEYPRTGAVLRQLAEYYDSDSKREKEWGRLHEYDF